MLHGHLLYVRSHVIYKFQCSNCNVIYYDQTARHLKVRVMSALTEKTVSNNKKSAFKDHCYFSGHVCRFGDSTILIYEFHKFKHLIKEPLLVTKDKPLLKGS